VTEEPDPELCERVAEEVRKRKGRWSGRAAADVRMVLLRSSARGTAGIRARQLRPTTHRRADAGARRHRAVARPRRAERMKSKARKESSGRSRALRCARCGQAIRGRYVAGIGVCCPHLRRQAESLSR
jgi:hypothetical protein